MVEIKRGLPIPTVHGRGIGRPTKYPWRELAVGDAFPVHIHSLSSVRAAALAYGKKHGLTFLVAKADGTDEYWCWRTA